MRHVSIALLLAFTAVKASAQTNAALIANDHYTRMHNYDLIHQRIVITELSWDSTSISGRVTSTLVARRAGLDSLILDEGALLANASVTDKGGATLRTARHGDTLVVFPARPARLGDTLTLTIAYHGKVKSGDGLTWIRSDGLPHRPDQIWSQGEDHNNHFWFPTYDSPNDKMSWEMVVTVPSADMAISNGVLVSDVVSGASRTVTWREDEPSATYLVSLVVAPLVKLHDSWEGIPVDYYVYRADSSKAWRLFHVTPDMIGTYSRLTGIKYPWAKYAQTTVADFFGGMENVSATTLVDWLPDDRAYPDRPWYQHILIPHELAHQWFGDYVTTVDWANMWLNEGFAEFMPGQYWNEKLGEHAEQDYYADEYEQYMSLEHRRSMPLASLGSNNIYPKGALVLEMLKSVLGKEPFWASIHAYLTAHAFGNASSEDLKKAVLAATGQNLDWFWDEWVYQAGHPQLLVSAAYDSARSSLALTVKQVQTDSLKADSTGLKFTVPQVFRMPLVVRVGTASGVVDQKVELNAREQVITIAGVRTPPTMVVFDAGNSVLKQLVFDQPTAWLAMQLRTDPNLWNREWAIENLAGRKADGAAGAALADAAMHADYFLTRAQAADALAEFSTAVAMPALSAALKDTSAAVRSAAIGSLGAVGGAAAVAPAQEAFAHDASYGVRAAALEVLVHADPVHAHEIIAEGLRTPSYQEAIQHSALRGVAQTGDTAFIGAVEGMLDLDVLPSHVLAFFAAKGNARALDLLTKHLNDDRAGVRRWVLQGWEGTFAGQNHDVAVQRLRAALDGLTHADTRQAATDLLKRLDKAGG